MSEVSLFKRGSDLESETRLEDAETVTCLGCGAREPNETAFENGWQLAPSVCPDCIRWEAVAEAADA